MKNVKILEKIYLFISVIILILIVLTPYIIREGVSIFSEEIVEALMIAILLILFYIVLRLYQTEIKKCLELFKNLQGVKDGLEERLIESFKYIGSVNIQISEIKSAFSEIKKYPASRQDLKYIMQFLAQKILSMTNAEWVLLRIIDITSGTTLREHCETRGNATLFKYNFSNKDLLDSGSVNGYEIIKSTQENFNLKTFCIMPVDNLSKDQEILIAAIVNQLEMLFLIFTSNYYKNSGNNKLN